jgi:cytochrome c556
VKGRAIGALAVLVVLVAAGCGSSGGGGEPLTKAQYEQKLNSIGTTIDTSFNELSQMFQGDTPSFDAAATKVADIQDELRTQADELDKVTPPENVKTEHEEMVDGLRGFADDLDDFRKAVADGSVAGIQQFADTFTKSDSAKKIQAAGDSLKKKGYDLQGNSGG